MIPLAGFAPDADSTTPGVILAANNVIPSLRGLKAFPSPADVGMPALAAACQGAAMAVKLDGTSRTFAGTQTKLYELVSGAWSDVGRGTNYSVATDLVWRFAQFGNDTLAANKADTLQRSSGAAFADVSGAPKASLVEAVSGFVILADTNEATYGDSPDRWWCSAIYDPTSWTPNVSTQCTTGRLVDTAGAIVGLRALGDQVVIYKNRAIHVGTYTGAPAVWSFHAVAGRVGAVSNEAIVSIGTAHYFIGSEDIYYFDGSRPEPIATGAVRAWFFSRLAKASAYKIKGMHDRVNGAVYWFYPTTNSALDSVLIYNYKTQKWGAATLSVEVPVEIITGGYTIDGLDGLSATIDGLPPISFDSPFWISGQPVPAVVTTDHKPKPLNGAAGSSSITTGDMGDDQYRSVLNRFRMRWAVPPTTATAYGMAIDDLGTTPDQQSTASMAGNRFDLLQDGKWHRIQIDMTGDWELLGYQPDLVQGGEF